MIDVLKRRKEIEDYLTALQVTRVEEDAPVKVSDDPVKPLAPPPVAPAPVTSPAQPKPTPEPASPVQPPVTTPVQPQPTPQPTSPPVTKPVQAPPPVKDSVKKTPPIFVYNAFKLTLDEPFYLVMLLDKVDPVYIREARTALQRYHRDIGNGQTIEINKDLLDVNQELLVYVQFNNADEAFQYYEKVKKAAPVEISWLPPTKYTFFIITEANLQLLKTNKDLAGYKKLLNMQYPGKF